MNNLRRRHSGLKLLLAMSGFASGFVSAADATDYATLSGQDLFGRFCSSCHGPEGRGDGTLARTFPREVPDLTLFARRHGGEFPRDLAERIIDGRHVIGAHGSRTMPIWGEQLSRAAIGDPNAERAVRIVTGRLADYLWLLQRPSAATGAPVTSPNASKSPTVERDTKPH